MSPIFMLSLGFQVRLETGCKDPIADNGLTVKENFGSDAGEGGLEMSRRRYGDKLGLLRKLQPNGCLPTRAITVNMYPGELLSVFH